MSDETTVDETMGCADCGSRLDDGPHRARLAGVIDGIPLYVLVCLPCWVTQPTEEADA